MWCTPEIQLKLHIKNNYKIKTIFLFKSFCKISLYTQETIRMGNFFLQSTHMKKSHLAWGLALYVALPPGTHKELLVLSGALSSSRSSSFPRNKKDTCDGQMSRFPLKNLEYVYFKFYKRFNAQIDKNLSVKEGNNMHCYNDNCSDIIFTFPSQLYGAVYLTLVVYYPSTFKHLTLSTFFTSPEPQNQYQPNFTHRMLRL